MLRVLRACMFSHSLGGQRTFRRGPLRRQGCADSGPSAPRPGTRRFPHCGRSLPLMATTVDAPFRAFGPRVCSPLKCLTSAETKCGIYVPTAPTINRSLPNCRIRRTDTRIYLLSPCTWLHVLSRSNVWTSSGKCPFNVPGRVRRRCCWIGRGLLRGRSGGIHGYAAPRCQRGLR